MVMFSLILLHITRRTCRPRNRMIVLSGLLFRITKVVLEGCLALNIIEHVNKCM